MTEHSLNFDPLTLDADSGVPTHATISDRLTYGVADVAFAHLRGIPTEQMIESRARDLGAQVVLAAHAIPAAALEGAVEDMRSVLREQGWAVAEERMERVLAQRSEASERENGGAA